MKQSNIDKIKQRIHSMIYINKHRRLFFETIQWASHEEIAKLQTVKLRNIVKNALQYVPHYKSLKIDIDIDNFVLSDLLKFPIVDKEIIRNNPSLFLSTSRKGINSQTSGSSGTPFEYYIPYNSGAIELLTAQRAWTMGRDYSYLPGDPVVMLRSYAPKEGQSLLMVNKNYNYYFLSPFHINLDNLHFYIQTIEKSGTKILRGYPSSLYIFTLLLKEKKIKLPQIRTLITSSETLLPHYREVVENYFGLKILDWYGQNENTVTVQQCWAGNYHNNVDYGYLEFNENHEFIATSLNNYVMPFIRYNTKDKAVPLNEQLKECPCGRSFSIPFLAIEGRSDDLLIKKDGTLIPTVNIYTAFKKFSVISQFQIIQDSQRNIELNVVAEQMTNELYYQIKLELTNRVGNVEVKVNKIEYIPRDIKTGKIKVIIQKLS
jgi:phenylacetate-CoA ligase